MYLFYVTFIKWHNFIYISYSKQRFDGFVFKITQILNTHYFFVFNILMIILFAFNFNSNRLCWMGSHHCFITISRKTQNNYNKISIKLKTFIMNYGVEKIQNKNNSKNNSKTNNNKKMSFQCFNNWTITPHTTRLSLISNKCPACKFFLSLNTHNTIFF